MREVRRSFQLHRVIGASPYKKWGFSPLFFFLMCQALAAAAAYELVTARIRALALRLADRLAYPRFPSSALTKGGWRAQSMFWCDLCREWLAYSGLHPLLCCLSHPRLYCLSHPCLCCPEPCLCDLSLPVFKVGGK